MTQKFGVVVSPLESAREVAENALAEIVAGSMPGRHSPAVNTLFWSVGLAGTEVVVANGIFDTITRQGAC